MSDPSGQYPQQPQYQQQQQFPQPQYNPVPPYPGYGYPLPPDPSTPLEQPYYGIGFIAGWKRYWKKYATFTGRASRSEFWWACLGNVIIGLAIYVLLGVPAFIVGVTAPDGDSFPPAAAVLLVIFGILFLLWGLASIVPSWALLWRRLHDANLAGPLALLVLVPSLGGIWSLVIGFLPSSPLGARFDDR